MFCYLYIAHYRFVLAIYSANQLLSNIGLSLGNRAQHIHYTPFRLPSVCVFACLLSVLLSPCFVRLNFEC